MDSTVVAPDTPFLGSNKETVSEETIKVLLKAASDSNRLSFADLALRTDDILIMLADEIQNARSALHLQEVNFNNCVIYTKDKGFELFIDILCELRSLEIFIARKSDLQPDIGPHMEKLITSSGCLRVLDFNGNSLQSMGVTALSKAFYRNINELPNDSSLFSLQFLHLSYNNIGDSGVLALCRGLVQFARRSFATSRPCRMRCLALSGNHLTDKAAYCLAQLLNTKSIGSTSSNGSNSGKIHSPKGLFNHFQFPLEELQLEDNPEIGGRGLSALLGDVKTSMYSPLKRLKAAHCACDCAAIEGLSTVLLQQSSPLLELLDISMTENTAEKCIQQSASQFSRVYGTPIAQSLHGSLKRLSDTLLSLDDSKPRFTLTLGSLHKVIFNHACKPATRNEEEDCLRALEALNPASRFLGPPIPRILGSVRDWVSAGVYEVSHQSGNGVSHHHHKDTSSNIVAMEIEVVGASESFFASPPPALPSPPSSTGTAVTTKEAGENNEANSAAKQAFLQRMASRRSNSNSNNHNTAVKVEEQKEIRSPYSEQLSSLQELKVVDQVTPRQSHSAAVANKNEDNNNGSHKNEKQNYDRYGHKIGLSSSSLFSSSSQHQLHRGHSHSKNGGVSFGSHPASSSRSTKTATTAAIDKYKSNRNKKDRKIVKDGNESDNPLLSLSTELRLALSPRKDEAREQQEPAEQEEQPLSAQVRGVLGDLSSRLAMIATQQRQRDDLRARHVTQALLVHQMAAEKEKQAKRKKSLLSKSVSKMSVKSSQKTENDDDDNEEGREGNDDDDDDDDDDDESVEELLDSDSVSPSPPSDKQKNKSKSNNKTNKTAIDKVHTSNKKDKQKGQEAAEQRLTAESVAAMIEARLTGAASSRPVHSNAASSTAVTTTHSTHNNYESEAEQLKRCQEELETLRTVSSSRDTSLVQKLQSLEHRLLRMELALTGTTAATVGSSSNHSIHNAVLADNRQLPIPGYGYSGSHGSTTSTGKSTATTRPLAIETRLVQQLGGLHLLDHINRHPAADREGGGGGNGGAWVNELGHRLEAIEQMLRADKQFHQQLEEEDLHRKIEDRRALRHRWIEALASQQPLPDFNSTDSNSKQRQMQMQQEPSDRDEVESVASIYSLPRYGNKGNQSVPGTPIATTQLHSISKDHNNGDNNGMYPHPLTPSHLPPLPFMSAALHSHSASSSSFEGGGGGGNKEGFIRPVIPDYEFATLRPPSGSWDAYDSSRGQGPIQEQGSRGHGGSGKKASRVSKSYMQSTNSSRKLKQYGAATTPL